MENNYKKYNEMDDEKLRESYIKKFEQVSGIFRGTIPSTPKLSISHQELVKDNVVLDIGLNLTEAFQNHAKAIKSFTNHYLK